MTCRNPLKRHTITSAIILLFGASLLSLDIFAASPMTASATAKISITKSPTAGLATTQQFIVGTRTQSSISSDDDSLCLNIDLTNYRVSYSNTVLLTGALTGKSERAPVDAISLSHSVNKRCIGSTMVLVTDTSALNNNHNDFYTGSLRIIISAM